MKRRSGGWNRRLVTAFAVCFLAGGMADCWLRTNVLVEPSPPAQARVSAPPPPTLRVPPPRIGPIIEEPPDEPQALEEGSTDAVAELRRRALRLPVDSASAERMRGQFSQSRGSRTHEAVDLLAPRQTPVRAVDDGTIAKLFLSKAGGVTIYQFDSEERFCYYYAHLDHYAEGLHDGQQVRRGEVLGYVGTTGNAPPNTPHLHFAIFELTSARRWWKGRAIDPYAVFATDLRQTANVS